MAEGGAALPWAAQAEADRALATAENADASVMLTENDLEPVSMQQLGLEAGARIEVLWQVSVDDGEETSKWFPATLSCSTSAQQQQQSAPPAQSGAAAPTPDALPSSSAASAPSAAAGTDGTQPHQQLRYTLTYDGSEDFPEEIATVLLLSDHGLYDMEKRDILVWRREGDSYEPAEEDETVDPRDIMASEEEAAAGEAAMLARLSDLTQSESGKAYVMAGYQDFKEQLKAFIAAKAACSDQGSGVLITASDVHEFSNMMKTQRATAASHRH